MDQLGQYYHLNNIKPFNPWIYGVFVLKFRSFEKNFLPLFFSLCFMWHFQLLILKIACQIEKCNYFVSIYLIYYSLSECTYQWLELFLALFCSTHQIIPYMLLLKNKGSLLYMCMPFACFIYHSTPGKIWRTVFCKSITVILILIERIHLVCMMAIFVVTLTTSAIN